MLLLRLLRSRCRRRLRRGLRLLLRLRRDRCRHLVADLLLLLVGRLLDGLVRGLMSGLLCGLLSGLLGSLLSSLLSRLLSSLLGGLLGSLLLQLLLHRPAVRLLGRAQSGPLLVSRRSWNGCVLRRLCLVLLRRLLFFHGQCRRHLEDGSRLRRRRGADLCESWPGGEAEDSVARYGGPRGSSWLSEVLNMAAGYRGGSPARR